MSSIYLCYIYPGSPQDLEKGVVKALKLGSACCVQSPNTCYAFQYTLLLFFIELDFLVHIARAQIFQPSQQLLTLIPYIDNHLDKQRNLYILTAAT